MKVFVTVGTTKFEKLIEEVAKDEILDILQDQGYKLVQFQTGSGQHEIKTHKSVQLKYEKFFEDFSETVKKFDLVISHAGAGTCLEVLTSQKPLIVVVNEDLMDNHQTELAEHLAKEGYLQCCTVKTLKNVLLQNEFNDFKLYPKSSPKTFSNYLDDCMGFKSK